jgi:hypothetical protein
LTVRVVAGLKIWPPKIGRPRTSVPIRLLVSSALKSPALNASTGVVLPKPSSVPERKRVQSALMKKNVLFLMMGPPSVAPQFLLSSGVFGSLKKPFGVQGVVGEVAVGAAVEPVGARLGGVFDEAAAGMAVLGGVGRGDDRDLLDGLDGRSALLAPLVAGGISERAAVEEVLRPPAPGPR